MIDLHTYTHQLIEEPHEPVIALELTPEVEVIHAMLLAHQFEGSGRHWPLGPIPTHKKPTIAPKKRCLLFLPENGEAKRIGAGWVVYGNDGLPTQALKVADFKELYRPIERDGEGGADA